MAKKPVTLDGLLNTATKPLDTAINAVATLSTLL